MAQTGFTPIALYYSSTTTNVPTNTNLADGELAINITDGKLFYKDNSSVVQVIGWKTTPATAGGTGLTAVGTSGNVLTSNGTTWVSSAPTGAIAPIAYNLTTVSSNLTIVAGQNGLSVGPMTINSGSSVTVTSGQRWVVL